MAIGASTALTTKTLVNEINGATNIVNLVAKVGSGLVTTELLAIMPGTGGNNISGEVIAVSGTSGGHLRILVSGMSGGP